MTEHVLSVGDNYRAFRILCGVLKMIQQRSLSGIKIAFVGQQKLLKALCLWSKMDQEVVLKTLLDSGVKLQPLRARGSVNALIGDAV